VTVSDGQPGLPPLQLEVARTFFALPASRGFLLAGGAALLAQHLTASPPRTSTSSPLPSAGMFPPPAMPWRPRPPARLDHRADPRQRHVLPDDHPQR
jgi:hypothetical protein